MATFDAVSFEHHGGCTRVGRVRLVGGVQAAEQHAAEVRGVDVGELGGGQLGDEQQDVGVRLALVEAGVTLVELNERLVGGALLRWRGMEREAEMEGTFTECLCLQFVIEYEPLFSCSCCQLAGRRPSSNVMLIEIYKS